MNQTKLDCRGLRCPMPIVKLSQEMRKLNVGDRLTVEATDSAFEPDVIAWTRQLGHSIVTFADGETKVAVIEKGAPRG